jgi:nitrogen-specific signal transduction histidine kinase
MDGKVENSDIKHINQILDLLLQEKVSLSKFTENCFKYLFEKLRISSLYCFGFDHEMNLIEKYSLPSESSTEKISIQADKLPIILDTVRSNRVAFYDYTESQRISISDLKSIFKIEFKYMFICPVSADGKEDIVIIGIEADKTKLSSYGTSIIVLIKKILELGYHFKETNWDRISQRENLETTQSLDFFHFVLNQLNFGIIVLNNDLKIQYMNKESFKLLQLQQKPDDAATLQEVLGEQNITTILDARENLGSTFERPEIELITPQGEKILVGFTVTNIMEDGGDSGGFILLLKDITISKEFQEEIRRMDRLASLGVMASGIAHEIRNPLAGIKAIAQTFEDELSKNDPKLEYVERIIKQVNRLDDLLKSLFSYAKPPKPNRQFHKIKEILHDVLPLLKQKIQSHDIKLKQIYERNLPPVFVDNSQIQQVIFNLILNGIEAIESEGEIRISAERVNREKISMQRKPFYQNVASNPYIQILISDTGCGIPSENLQQIFNPFFTTKTFGTGLGLSIVYQIIQENNGIIYFESFPSQGTNCFLFLPAYDEIHGSN